MSRNYKKNNRNTRRGKEQDVKGGKKDSFKPKFDKATATNSPDWYATDPALLRDSASIPFSWSVGTPINLHNPALNQLSSQEFAIPGICAIELAPSVGFSADAADPINVAMFQFYSDVRYANSGHSNYDAPDLMLYIMAMSQVYSYINYLQRIYGAATLYAQRNRYLPDALLRAMKVDVASVKSNLANFRYGINVLINNAAKFYVPAVMPIFQRHASLYSNVYVEGVSIKDQMYLYVPAGFWKFNLDISTQAGMLEFKELPSTSMTVDQLLEYGTDMLARLTMSEDMNIMSGDILKAYGEGGMIKLQSLPTDYPLAPIFDAAVLEQMKNATLVGQINASNLAIRQDATKAFLVHKPNVQMDFIDSPLPEYQKRAMTYILNSLSEDRILTTQNLEPTPEIVMENTRLMAYGFDFERSTEGDFASIYVGCGSEIALFARIWYYEGEDNDGTWQLNYQTVMSIMPCPLDADNVFTMLKQVNVSSPFKFRPFVHVIPYRQGSTDNSFQVGEVLLNFDVDNYAVLSESDLEHIHATALMSELHVRNGNKLG